MDKPCHHHRLTAHCYECDAQNVKTLVFDESCTVPCTAELEVKLGKLVERFEHEHDNWKDTQFALGASYGYGCAASMLREILGWDKR